MKKIKSLSLLLSLILALQCLAVPASAIEGLETVPVSVPEVTGATEEMTTPAQIPFGKVSVLQGCRTIDGLVPLAGSDRMLDTAQAVFCYEVNTGTVIYSYNPDMKLAPGSLAKVVTALVAIEQCDDLDEMVTVSSRNISRLPAGSLHVDLKEQEKITMRDLLYCMVLYNANDAAIAIAEHISGNMQGFLVLMNDRVKQLGCVNTEFANVHGLDNAVQYTTARDMTKIMIEASKNETSSDFSGS